MTGRGARPGEPALIPPTYLTGPDYVSTLGPEVADLNEAIGFGPDPEQRLVLDHMLGMTKRGRLAAVEVAVICNRQNLKTGVLKQAAIGKAFLLERRLHIWSAHEFGTAQEAFRDLCNLIESSPMLERRVLRVRRGNGDESIELRSGGRIMFKARTKGGGRGLSGDDVDLDEAFALQPEHLGAILPVLATFADPQIVYASSAGLRESVSLRAIRDRGRAGRSARLVWIEWTDEGKCADPECSHEAGVAVGCRADDEDAWVAVNPAIARGRITLDYVRAERAAMPPAQFFRERMGRWDDPLQGGDIFAPVEWSDLGVDPEVDPAPERPEVVAFALSVDRLSLSIAAAGHLTDGRVFLGAVRSQAGTAGVGDVLLDAQQRHGCEVVVDGRGPAGSLVAALEETHPELVIRVLGVDDVIGASSWLYDSAQDGQIAHHNHPDLDDAVKAAAWRNIGDRRVLGRRQSAGDVSMLEAAALAGYAVGGSDYDVFDSIH